MLSERSGRRSAPTSRAIPSKRAVTLPALHIVHEHLRCVPYQAMAEIAELLELTAGRSARHDELLRLLPAGPHRRRRGSGSAGRSPACSAAATSCSGIACKNARRRRPGQTSEDGKLTVEFAECLGICDFAPAALCDDGRIYGPLDEQSTDAMVKDVRERDGPGRSAGP